MKNNPHSTKENDQSQNLFSMLIGLSMRCPFDQSNPCECPFFEVRQMPLDERYRWAKSLSEAEVEAVCDRHWACLVGKQKPDGGGNEGDAIL
jgi:hypothetical protein